MYNSWGNIPEWSIPNEYIPNTVVSVIIAARNEEDTIEKCILSILNCNYPKSLLEIIVVDDHSTDQTNAIIKKYTNQGIKLLNLIETTGKKQAISNAIQASKGKLIICTDADCIVSATWLNSIVSLYQSNSKRLIVAPIVYKSNTSIIQKFQFLDGINNMCVTAVGIDKQSFFLANGANFIYEKSLFNEINGLDDSMHIPSGDDVFLIKK
ncbi:MAG: glycosyltransferase, partial [Saprospiraceae bacterium]